MLKSKRKGVRALFENSLLVPDAQKGSDPIFLQVGGARRDRTADLLRARQALSQLSYGPLTCLFSVWLCCVFCSVGHVFVHTLPSLQKPRRANRKKSCVIVHSDFDKGPFFGNQGEVSRHIACYASGASTPSPGKWWVWEELNFRPHPYQGCALTN